MSKNFLATLGDAAGESMESSLSDNTGPQNWISTGSYILNALLSGSIYGGLPDNKISQLCGLSGSGKSYIAMSAARDFLTKHEHGVVLYYDTEYATAIDMAKSLGCDMHRMRLIRPKHVEDWRVKAIKVLKKLEELADERPPVMMVLDSLGAIQSKKQFEEGEEEDTKSDMGKRSAAVGAAMMTLNQYFGALNVPLIIINHLYTNVSGYGESHKRPGGEKVEFLSSVILQLSKKKLGTKEEQTGIIVHAKNLKGRYGRVGREVDAAIRFDRGLDRYYGLVDLALKYEIFGKSAKHIILPDGSKQFISQIENDPERFFPPEILVRLDEVARQEYGIGNAGGSLWETDNSNT